ncbi:MAG: hypothetical protein RR620_08910 [Clostridium sp.]
MKKKKSYNLQVKTLDYINDFFSDAGKINDTDKLEGVIELFEDLYDDTFESMDSLLDYNEMLFLINCYKDIAPSYNKIKCRDFFINIISENFKLATYFNVDTNSLISIIRNSNALERLVLLREIYRCINSEILIPEEHNLINKETINNVVKLTSWSELGMETENIYNFKSGMIMSRFTHMDELSDTSLLFGAGIDHLNKDALSKFFTERGLSNDVIEIMLNYPNIEGWEYITEDKYYLAIENNTDESTLNKMLKEIHGTVSTYSGIKPRFEVEYIYGSSIVLKFIDTVIPKTYYYCKKAKNFDEALEEIYSINELWIDIEALNNLPEQEVERIKERKFIYKDKISRWEKVDKINII